MSLKIYQEEKKKRDDARAAEFAKSEEARIRSIMRPLVPFGEKRQLHEIQLERDSPRPFEVRNSFLNAWNLLKANLGKTIGLFVLVTVLSALFYYLFLFGMLYVGATVQWLLGDSSLFGMKAYYLLTLFYTSFVGGLGFCVHVPMMLRLIRNQPVNLVLDLYELKRLFGAIIKTTLLFSIFLTLCSITVIGGVLFFFAASFSLVLVVDKNITGVDSIRASWRIIQNRKADFGIFVLATLCVNLVSLAVVFLFFLTVPITVIAFLTIYDSIVEPGNAYLASEGVEIDPAIFS